MQADALLITFQGQLSGIMESILRSALVEITRLVEGSFLEEVGRGKQQADVLRRRVQVLENRLAERERVKRVRCADCGRAGLKKDSGGRETRTKTGLEAACAAKLEGASEGGRRSCEGRGVTSSQEETSARSDSEKIADGIGAKMEGVIKDEDPRMEEKQVCSSARGYSDDPDESQSHAVRERAGICTSQPEVQSPQRDKLPVTAGQDLIKQRSPLRKAEHHAHSSHAQPPQSTGGAPPEVPPTVNQATSYLESVAIKQEVVVVLPPDWSATSASGRVNRAPEVQRTTPPAPPEDKHSYPGHCAKESHSTAVTDKNQPKPAEHSSPGTVGPSYPKSPPVPNPSRMLPQFHRVYAGEGAVASVQTGRTPAHALAVRAHGHVGGHHMARRPYICSHCGKVFSQLCHLKGHQQIHTGERQFCCNLCGRSFTKLSNLKAHRRVHTGERPYICLDCGKRFTQKCNLKRHQRIHSAHL